MWDNTLIHTLSGRKELKLTYFISHPSAITIRLRNVKQPSDGLNGCNTNRLLASAQYFALQIQLNEVPLLTRAQARVAGCPES
jgi:hypothetical protein